MNRFNAPTEKIDFTLGNPGQKKVAVFSHERSGTHFLMNSIAQNFSYRSHPWWNFDQNLNLNFRKPAEIRTYFEDLEDQAILNILKSHHAVEFVAPVLEYLSAHFHLFYIYRDPRDVMLSFRKLVDHLEWYQGPDCSSIGNFIRSAPEGAMLRYQQQSAPNLLRRWANHVDGWLDFIEAHPHLPILPIAYEDLNLRFEATMQKVARFLNQPCTDIQRPSPYYKVILAGAGKVGNYKKELNEVDQQYILAQVEETIKRGRDLKEK